MEKLYIFLCLAVLCNGTFGLSVRNKRQSTDNNEDGDLDDRYGFMNGFPEQNGFDLFPNRPRPFPGQRPTARPFPRPVDPQPQPTPAPNPGSTTVSSAVNECIRSCPVTAEYNPVCGTNNVQYSNPGRLTCATACGINVSLLRASPCPPSTPAPAPEQ